MADLRIRLFGELRAFDGERPIADLGSTRDQALWAYLILNSGDAQRRSRLAFQFWPDSTESAARNRLRHALYVLRRALPPVQPELDWLLTGQDTVRWNPGAPATIDVVQFRNALAFLPANAQPADQTFARIEQVEAAVDLYRGDLLEGWYDDWVLAERQTYRDMLFAALEWLVGAYERRGDGSRAIAAANRLIGHDRLREESHRLLMGLFARLGDRASAIRQYELCRQILVRDLDVEPSIETQRLYEAIRGGQVPVSPPVEPPAVQEQPVEAPPPRSGAPTLARPATPIVGVAPLVGRERELAELQRRWEAARNGEGGVVLVAGEPGLGKTRLLAELCESVGDQGIVLVGRSREAELLTPYFPIVEAIRAHLDEAGSVLPASLSAVDPIWLAELARLLPDIRTRRPEIPEPVRLEPALERLRLIEGLTRCLLAIARRPTVVVLDDLQWADEATMAWIEHVATRLAGTRILVAGTYRTGEPAPSLQRLRQRLIRDGWDGEIILERLANDDLFALIRDLSGSTAGIADLTRRLFEETGGNPLFVLETLRALLETGLLERAASGWQLNTLHEEWDGAHLPLPRTVREVIASRLNRLSESSRQLVSAASVLGREFDIPLLNALTSKSEDEVLDALDELLAAQIVVEQGVRYAFSHDKVQEVAYEQLSAARKIRLHSLAGEALETRFAGRTEGAASQLGRHFRMARRFVEAANYLTLAGDNALRTYAYREACQSYLQAVEGLESLPAADDDLRRQRIGLRLRLAQAAFYVEPGPLRRWLEPAAADAAALGDPVLKVQVSMAQAGALYIAGNFDASEAQIRPLLDAAIQTGNSALEIRARHMLGRIEVLRGDLHEGRRNLQQALAGSAGVMNTTEIIVSSDMAAGALSVLGDFETALEESRALLHAAEETGDPATLAAAQVFLLAIYQHRGMWREATDIGREAIARARDAANFIYEYDALAFLGLAVARGGDISGGIEIQESAIQLAKQAQINLLMGRTYGWLAEIYRLAGRLEDSRDAALAGLSLAQDAGNRFERALCQRQLGETFLALGDTAAAREQLDDAAAEFEAESALPELLRTRLAIAALAAATGDPAAPQLAAVARARLADLGIVVDSTVAAG